MNEPQPQDSFYIASPGSPSEQRPRVLKAERVFGVFDRYGDVPAADPGPKGLFRDDTRYLSHYELLLAGTRPLFLSSSDHQSTSMLWVDLTNPDRLEGERVVVGRDLIHIARLKVLRPEGCCERVTLENFDERRHEVRLSLRFAADFRDMFELRGQRRKRRGRVSVETAGDTALLHYRAIDGRPAITCLRFEPAPTRLDECTAEFDIELMPHARAIVLIDVTLDEGVPNAPPTLCFTTSVEASRKLRETRDEQRVRLTTPDRLLSGVLDRATADLDLLTTETAEGPYPYAGIPWFTTVFGRDGIITALLAGWLDPSLSQGVLRHLAVNQATALDEAAVAEPGKILHEVRAGEMARLGEVPFARYYGSVDSTPLFLMLLGCHVRQTGSLQLARDLWPNVEAALEWIHRWGDVDGDGFVEYRSHEAGLHNQGWKDSQDSVMHADGGLALGPIALVEVQAYVQAALIEVAWVASRLGKPGMAERLTEQAVQMRRRFEAAFWDEELNTYGLALDGAKRLCRVRSSNAGHVLLSDMVEPGRAALIAEHMLCTDQYSGWGVRTLAKGEHRYNPMSYHNGSIWPHDNALIARGLARHGLRKHAAVVATGLFDAALAIDQNRLPELFCGFDRDDRLEPVRYPVACSPQAWAAASLPGALRACIGLDFDHERGTIRLEQPTLPGGWRELHLSGLRVGEDTADLVIRRRRADEIVTVDVLRRTGQLRVSVDY